MYKVKLRDTGNDYYGVKKGEIFEFSSPEEKDKFLLTNKLKVDWIDWNDGRGPQKLILDLCGSMAWHPIKEQEGKR